MRRISTNEHPKPKTFDRTNTIIQWERSRCKISPEQRRDSYFFISVVVIGVLEILSKNGLFDEQLIGIP